MKATIYIETSVISYLVARPSRDLIVASHQKITHDWWEKRRNDFNLFVSELVRVEAMAGDAEAAQRRLDIVHMFEFLPVDTVAQSIASEIVKACNLPAKAQVDALHVAVAARGGIDYLLTWNCSHIANAELFEPMKIVCTNYQLKMPTLCTPEELLGADDET